jgi:hypothetical protein
MERQMSEVKLIKWLIKAYIYVFISFIFLLHVFFLFFFFFVSVTCIIGVILFVYLCCTRQLVISRKVFFLLPHILLYFGIMGRLDYSSFSQFAEWSWSFYDAVYLCYLIIKCGMPFLLYCLLQIIEGRLAIIARIFCFVLPIVSSISIASFFPR